jgi:hypothetical protein
MRFLRTFETPSWFDEWHLKKPRLEVLLRCFDRNGPSSDPVSVFTIRNPIEELECVAARVQTYKSSELKNHFGVRFDDSECQMARIKLQPTPDEGLTGIKCVDARHYNLIGNQDEFTELIKLIIKKMYGGDERLRKFPPNQVRTQLTMFAHLQKGDLDNAAIARCTKILEKYAVPIVEKDKIKVYNELERNGQPVRIETERQLVDTSKRIIFRTLMLVWHELSRKIRGSASN